MLLLIFICRHLVVGTRIPALLAPLRLHDLHLLHYRVKLAPLLLLQLLLSRSSRPLRCLVAVLLARLLKLHLQFARLHLQVLQLDAQVVLLRLALCVDGAEAVGLDSPLRAVRVRVAAGHRI